MSEFLHIKNFGPIKEVKLKLKRFNILIGENATGKSTVAKILAVCRYFSYLIWDGSFEKTPYPNQSNFSLGLDAWGLSEYIRSDSFIFYECQHYSLTVENIKIDLSEYDQGNNSVKKILTSVFSESIKPLSEDFKNLLSELESLKPKSPDGYGYEDPFWTTPISFYQNNVSKVMDNPFYLPTERGLQSIFSLGKNSIQNIADSLYNQFARIDQILRFFKNETSIDPLDITYKNDNGKGYFKKNNESEFFSLFSAASGYQSTIPIVLVILHYVEVRKKKKTFIIEEPELNLFPSAQNKLMQFLVDKTVNYKNSVLISTHSPYLLTSLNNLMYAYEVGQNHKEEVNKLIDRKFWINPDDVAAYMLLTDGICEDILDREENLIKAEKIDGVSREINHEFDLMQNIKLGIESINS